MTALVVLSLVMTAAEPTAAAMILELRGDIEADRDGKRLRLDDGDLLLQGDKLSIPDGASIKAYVRPAGPVVSLKGPAEAVVEASGFRTSAPVTIRDPKLPTRAADGLIRQDSQSTLVGGLTLRGMKHPLVHPVVGMTVSTQTPAFSWPKLDGATNYRLELITAAEGRIIPVWRLETKETRTDYPSGKKPLIRGQGYRWRVFATLADGSVQPLIPELPFTVLGPELAAELEKVQSLAHSDDPADWRLAAEIYRSWALYDEPLQLYEKLAKHHPESRRIWELLARYYEQAGDSERQKAAEEMLAKLKASH